MPRVDISQENRVGGGHNGRAPRAVPALAITPVPAAGDRLSAAELRDVAALLLASTGELSGDGRERAWRLASRLDAEAARLSAWQAAANLQRHEEAAFWDARPELRTIRDFARARMMGPWAVLGAVLVRAMTAAPWQLVLPATIGGKVGAGLYVAPTGISSAGKNSADRVAGELLPGAAVHSIGLATGEGIAHQYRNVRKARRKDEEDQTVWLNRSVLFRINEIKGLKALMERSGQSLDAYLRAAWMSEDLGRATADDTRSFPLNALTYRTCLLVNLLPDLGGVLLSQKDEGTPQRFVYLPVADPLAPRLDALPDEPAPLRWDPPQLRDPGDETPLAVPIPRKAWQEVRAERDARNRGEWRGSLLDGHRNLGRLKVAMALGVLQAAQGRHSALPAVIKDIGGGELVIADDTRGDSRGRYPEASARGEYEVTPEDWELAGMIMCLSDSVRDGLVATGEAQARKVNTARAEAEADRAVIADSRREENAVSQMAAALLKVLTGKLGGEAAASDWRTTLRSDRRKYFEEAVELLLAQGKIERVVTERDAAGRGGSGARYRAA